MPIFAGILHAPETSSKLSHCLHTGGVAGSNPASPTRDTPCLSTFTSVRFSYSQRVPAHGHACLKYRREEPDRRRSGSPLPYTLPDQPRPLAATCGPSTAGPCYPGTIAAEGKNPDSENVLSLDGNAVDADWDSKVVDVATVDGAHDTRG